MMWGGPSELIDILRATPDLLRTLTRTVDDEQARQAPGDEEWSIVEVVAHLADVEDRAIQRIHRIVTETEPVLERMQPAQLAVERGYRQQRLSEVIPRFEQLRQERLRLLESLPAEAWERTARHVEHGVMTLYQLTVHMCQHDVTHLAQIARRIDS
jgi:uncharacterized damage-inducible protein DinB